ncbi:nucleotidyltransferase substrate binding protein [Telmatobacter bradus]|uniref:nucleotidyltransferase substrate binding protein n=1 Tax=Telmatobacter bradus TaxID=474953 RepID=UPI003B432831
MSNELDFTPLVNAVQRLAEGLTEYQGNTSYTLIRDGLVQRFEFTYEISHKMLKRYLQSILASPEEFNAMPFGDLIRTGNEHGLLLGNWSDWKRYREMRSKTSHTYDEEIALQVVAGIPAFLEEAQYLLEQLRKRNAE